LQTGIPVPKASKKPHRQTPAANIKNLKLAGPGWQLQAAKARFSEVFRLARTAGPQLITRQGKDGVVMMPVEQFERLVTRSRQPNSLVQFFRESPLVGLELDFDRDKDTGRDIEL
jgi:antitoxin Phd